MGMTLHTFPHRSLRRLAGAACAVGALTLAAGCGDDESSSDTTTAAAAETTVAAEPWLERYPVCVTAAPARVGARWVLTDQAGSLPLVEGATGMGALLACSEGRPAPVTAEWTPRGLVPLTAHLADRAVDLGPTADPSFLAAGA